MDGQLSPEMQELAREMRAKTVIDLSCTPPDAILVDDLLKTNARGIDVIAFFSENEEFRAIFANYDKGRTIKNFTAYVKRPGSLPPARPAVCRTVY
jgi:hypothetical protein